MYCVVIIGFFFRYFQTALVTSTLKALKVMRKDTGGKGGTIINISSVAALDQPSPSYFIYCGSKSAVLQFSNCIGVSIMKLFTTFSTFILRNFNTNCDIFGKTVTPVISISVCVCISLNVLKKKSINSIKILSYPRQNLKSIFVLYNWKHFTEARILFNNRSKSVNYMLWCYRFRHDTKYEKFRPNRRWKKGLYQQLLSQSNVCPVILHEFIKSSNA